jgi:hypothetical protein
MVAASLLLAATGCSGGDDASAGAAGGTATTVAPVATAVTPPPSAASPSGGRQPVPDPTIVPASTPVSWPPRPAGCPAFVEASEAAGGGPLGTTPAALGEVSGMAVSRTNPGLLWVHNDSGDQARLYLVGEDLAVRTTLDLPGVFALDWEAMSAGPGPGGEPWLWVADTGDNFLLRSFAELHGFPEPAFGATPPAQATAGGVVTLRVRYPDGPADVEAFAVDPRTGDGFLFLKTLDAAGRSDVLRVPASALREGGAVEAERAGAVAVSNGETGARAADLSGDGTLVAVKDLTTTSIWLRGPDDDLPALLAAEPEAPCHQELGRGEAMALAADGSQVWTLEEGVGKPLRRFATAG